VGSTPINVLPVPFGRRRKEWSFAEIGN
jgi:hypothetical protein